MTSASRVLFDACTLWNFAAVERLELLRTRYEGRCAWTESAQWETRRGVADLPYLQPLIGASWLGTPIATDDPLAVQQVDRIRRALGGAPGAPTQHLGEAEAIYYAELDRVTTVFATDDRDAFHTAQRRLTADHKRLTAAVACRGRGSCGPCRSGKTQELAQASLHGVHGVAGDEAEAATQGGGVTAEDVGDHHDRRWQRIIVT